MRPVGFTELGDWSPVGYINQRLQERHDLTGRSARHSM